MKDGYSTSWTQSKSEDCKDLDLYKKDVGVMFARYWTETRFVREA